MIVEVDEKGIATRINGLPVVFCEGDISDWFEKNFKKLSFTEIFKCQGNKTPDYIVRSENGDIKKVEIEFFSSSFFAHKHNVKDVDIVVCGSKNKEIEGVTIIELHSKYVFSWFEEITAPITTIRKSSTDKFLGYTEEPIEWIFPDFSR